MTLDDAGKLLGVLALDIADGQICTVCSFVNPKKLRHLGPFGNLRELLTRKMVRERQLGILSCPVYQRAYQFVAIVDRRLICSRLNSKRM